MVAENYVKVREVLLNRLRRKGDVSSFILEKVAEMKTQSSTTVGSEKEDGVVAPWRAVVHGLDPDYYS